MTDATRPTDAKRPPDPAAATDGRDRPLLVGVDVGGSKIAVLVVDHDERILARRVAATAAGAPDHAADEIAAVVSQALADAGGKAQQVAAIGVGVPGRVDPLTGTVTLAVNLGWSDLPLGVRLEERFGRPCVVENDVRAAALGLHRRGVIGDIDDLAYLAVGTGVSAGVVLDGRLHRGARGLAGEIGHVIVDPGGAVCACGQRGCLETLVSGSAIARLAREAIESGRETALAAPGRSGAATGNGSPAPTAVDVYRAAASGDPLATEIADAVGRRLAWAIHLLVMTYDVERVVLGGGVSHAGETFERPIQRELDRMRDASALAREQLNPDIVELLPPGADAGAWGAVVIAAAHAGVGAGRRWEEVGHVRQT
ncbi:MAG: glucokinase [Chloroflexota bacterium]|nr:glucokinase [Chloroflexota bacterium]